MQTTTITIGLLFGMILSGVLVAPLYMALPARYLDNWYYIPSTGSLTCLVLGLFIVGASGFFAALVDDDATIRNGAQAGFLTSLFAAVLLVLPVASIEASGGLLSLSNYDTMSIDRLSELTATALVAATWLPSATGVAVALFGAALGAIGGVVYDLWQGSSGRSARLVRRSLIPFLGLFGVGSGAAIAAIWASHLDRTVLPRLGHPAGLWERSLLAVPLLAAGATASWLVAWGMRDVVITWRDDRRFGAFLWLGTLLSFALLGPVLTAIFHLPLFTTPSPYIELLMIGGAVIIGFIGAVRSDAVKESHPRAFGELFAETLFSSALFVVVPLFVSVSAVIGQLVLVFPYVRALIGNAPFVDAPPVEVVTHVFRYHWAVLPVGLCVLALFFAVSFPSWLLQRALRR